MSNASARPYPRDLIPQGTPVLGLTPAEHSLQIFGLGQPSGAAQCLPLQRSSWVALAHQQVLGLNYLTLKKRLAPRRGGWLHKPSSSKVPGTRQENSLN